MLIEQLTGAVQRALEPRADAALSEQVHSMLARDPKAALHAANVNLARGLYSARGWQLCPTYGNALRAATPEERAAGDADPRNGLVEGDAHQLKLELARSNVIALEVPADLYHGAFGTPQCAPWDGLVASGARNCPAFASADGTTVTTLWRGPEVSAGQPVPERRRFTLDVSSGVDFARVKAHSDRKGANAIPLPHGGGPLERWITMGETFPAWPSELAGMLVADDLTSYPDGIAGWIAEHYRPARNGEHTTRAAVYESYLAANGLLPSDLDETAFSNGAGDVPKKRFKEGYRWLIERNDKPLASIRGVLCEMVSAEELSAFRQWRATRELSPARRKERAEHQAATKARVEAEGAVRKMYGSAAIQSHLAEIGFFAYFNEAEGRRSQGSAKYGEKHIPLSCAHSNFMVAPGTKFAEASWFVGVEKMTDPAQIYKLVVQRAVEGVTK